MVSFVDTTLLNEMSYRKGDAVSGCSFQVPRRMRMMSWGDPPRYALGRSSANITYTNALHSTFGTCIFILGSTLAAYP